MKDEADADLNAVDAEMDKIDQKIGARADKIDAALDDLDAKVDAKVNVDYADDCQMIAYAYAMEAELAILDACQEIEDYEAKYGKAEA